MKRPDLPELATTARHYVENTGRARLAGPGIERCAATRRRGAGGVLAALALLAALLGAMLWLAR